MPLDLNGPRTTTAIGEIAKKEPETELDLEATDADGGTVTASVNSSGAYWDASAWIKWAKDKGRSYGARVGLKF